LSQPVTFHRNSPIILSGQTVNMKLQTCNSAFAAVEGGGSGPSGKRAGADSPGSHVAQWPMLEQTAEFEVFAETIAHD